MKSALFKIATTSPAPTDINNTRPVAADDKWTPIEKRKTTRPAGTSAGCPGDEKNWL